METVMFLAKPAMVAAAAVLCVAGSAVSASAQQSCTGYYNQVMSAYQTLGPNSPQYNQMASDYSARCLSGASTAPSPAYYQAPYAYQPTLVDPAAAIVGAAVLGGVYNNGYGYPPSGYPGHTEHNYGNRW
jgi:hypothetical protein